MKRYLKILAGCLLAITLGSCVNERFDREPDDEGKISLNFLIPDYEGGAATFGTRAYNTEQEGYMSDLYIIAVKYADIKERDDDGNLLQQPIVTELDEKNRVVYTFEMNPVGETFHYDYEDYHSFHVALYPGKYKFAVIANADLYLWRTKKISDFTKEEDLQNIILYFDENTPLTPLHLPMVCLPWNIQYSDQNTTKTSVKDIEDNLVEISSSKRTTVFADLTFLCSKVRYTILFDKTEGGISEAFGNMWIRFNVDDNVKPRATNIRSYTRLLFDKDLEGIEARNDPEFDYKFLKHTEPSGASTEGIDGYSGATKGNDSPGWWTLGLDRFKWSEKEGADYPKSWKSTVDLWTGSVDQWITQERKVWQGIVYLPENLENTKTELEFPYYMAYSDEDSYEEPANKPKIIKLFEGDNQEKYEGLVGSGDNPDDYSGDEGTYTNLDRNYFYDVVALIKNPDADMDIKVFVNIIPWHEIDQSISDPKEKNNTSSQSEPNDPELQSDIEDWNYNELNSKW